MLMMAARAPGTVAVGDTAVDIERGQIATSIRSLCYRWRYRREEQGVEVVPGYASAHRFLATLRRDGLISLSSAGSGGAAVTVITVADFEKYCTGAGADTGGWVRLTTAVRRHWLWRRPRYLMWWLDLLMRAAWRDRTASYGTTVCRLKRGQLIASKRYLASVWQYRRDDGVLTAPSPDTAARFLKMLHTEKMIDYTPEKAGGGGSPLTVCNYERYQAFQRGVCATPEPPTNQACATPEPEAYHERTTKEPATDQPRTTDAPPTVPKRINEKEVNNTVVVDAVDEARKIFESSRQFTAYSNNKKIPTLILSQLLEESAEQVKAFAAGTALDTLGAKKWLLNTLNKKAEAWLAEQRRAERERLLLEQQRARAPIDRDAYRRGVALDAMERLAGTAATKPKPDNPF